MRGTALLLARCLSVNAVLAHPGSDTAIEEYSAQIRRDPGDASLYLRRGERHRDAGHWDLARADYQAARANTDDAAMHNQITFCVGRMKLEQGYPREALTLLDQVVAQNPGFGLARLNRARAWLTLGQTGKAVDEMDVFIGGLSSSAPDYYLERADMAMALDTGGYPRAVAGLEEGVARLGPLVTLVQRLVDLHQGQDDTDRALAALQSLPPALRGLPAWQARAGDIHRQAGDEIAAAAAYRRALAGIEALPAGRRSVPAVVELREEACLKLADCINCCVSAGANN